MPASIWPWRSDLTSDLKPINPITSLSSKCFQELIERWGKKFRVASSQVKMKP